ncbi:hypothetical protein L9F63_007208 [Diploptera punctata]|uniref:Uncharacterized protein n=1 Tax=Diploptera punctata TaxID=6984 RepID=A0AAD7Z8V3_DIPPU|nr:hypothetical protein L9F63_007208 [Diploptera punctata]
MDTFLGQHRKTVFDENRSCSTETQTEIDIDNSFLYECADDCDTTFTFSSNIETQTTEEFTAWPQFGSDDSMFVSTETQTALSVSSSNSNKSSKGTNSVTSHMETQTNRNEFQDLFVELSKQTSVDKLL